MKVASKQARRLLERGRVIELSLALFTVCLKAGISIIVRTDLQKWKVRDFRAAGTKRSLCGDAARMAFRRPS